MAVHCVLSTILGKKRIKMADLIRMSGVSKTTINVMYHDRAQRVDLDVMDRICKALDCDIPDLLSYVPDSEET